MPVFTYSNNYTAILPLNSLYQSDENYTNSPAKLNIISPLLPVSAGLKFYHGSGALQACFRPTEFKKDCSGRTASGAAAVYGLT